VGTFWAHLVSTEANPGELHSISFRSSAPVRLTDQHPETGSIPGSSTSLDLRGLLESLSAGGSGERTGAVVTGRALAQLASFHRGRNGCGRTC
jgi:hypothetical protein